MNSKLRRPLIALAAASGALLMFAGSAQAKGDAAKLHGAPAATQPAAAKGCDVPGAACDPSKTDHDNGVGNNCDPGYGEGNQAKFPPDESSTGCRSQSAPAPAAAGEAEAEQRGKAPAGTSGVEAAVAGLALPAAVTPPGTGSVLGASATAPNGGVAAAAGALPSGNAAQGAVLAATGLPFVGAGIGLLMLVFGGIASARRRL